MVLSPGTPLADWKHSSMLLPLWGKSKKLKTFLGAFIPILMFIFSCLLFGIVREENRVRKVLWGWLLGAEKESHIGLS